MNVFNRGKGQRRRGQALVEFALIIPLFLLLLVGIFDLGRAVFAYNTLTNAAREGARLAIVNQDLDTIITRAKEQSRIVELDTPNVEVQFWQEADNGTPDTSDPCNLVATNCLAVVRFEATYRPITPFISNIIFGNGVTFVATSILAVEYRCPNSHYPTANLCPKQP
jgi:Flp pilus assembly protein TadG